MYATYKSCMESTRLGLHQLDYSGYGIGQWVLTKKDRDGIQSVCIFSCTLYAARRRWCGFISDVNPGP